MYNLSNSGFSSDSTSPVNYVDTAYDALKYNAPATQQMLQAAQQGQPVGLAGLGAMAAQKFQQNAQSAQQQHNAMQQAPSPTVLQQIMSGGIMGQLQSNAALNQAPETPPQQMAMGGVVALNDGGFVDYSYDGGEAYAHGGEIRRFANGRGLDVEEPGWTFSGIGQGIADWWDKKEQRRLAEEKLYHEMEGRPASKQVDAIEESLTPMLVESSTPTPTPKAEQSSEQKKTDKAFDNRSQNEVHQEQDAAPKRLAETKGTTVKASGTPGLEPMPSEEIRAAEMARIREEMKGGAPQMQARPQTVSDTRGITSLPTDWDNKPTAGDYKDQIAALQEIYQGNLTGKLSPEVTSRLAAMEEQATRDKWLGALTAFGSGMFGADTPYMSQAIASGALRGLSTYRQGAQNEEQAALRNLQAQMEAEKEPEAARQKAISTYMQGQLQAGKSAADLRKEMMKGQTAMSRDIYKAGAAKQRAEIMANATKFSLSQQQALAAADHALKRGDELIKEWREVHIGEELSPEQENALREQATRETMQVAQRLLGGGVGLGTDAGMSGGAGMGSRPIIMGTSGQLIR